jgi:hypothetical protein
MPGLGSMIGLALTDSICSTVIPALSMATVAGVAGAAMSGVEFAATAGAMAYGANKFMGSGGAQEACADGVQVSEESRGLSTPDLLLFSHAKQLQSCLSQMDEHFFTEDTTTLALNNVVIQGIETKPGISAKSARYTFKNIGKKILDEQNKGGNADLVKGLTKVCESSGTIVKSIWATSQKENYTPEKVNILKSKLETVLDKISKINIQLTANSNVPAIHKKGPGALQKAKGAVGSAGKKSIIESNLKAAHMKLEVTKEQLKSVNQQADEAMKKQLEVNRRLQENLMQISKFKAEDATHAQIMEVLQQGLQAFGQLKDQWTKLLSFFHVSFS